MTDALKSIAENTARFGGGSSMSKRYADILRPKPQDNRTGEQIAADVIAKTGIKVVRSD